MNVHLKTFVALSAGLLLYAQAAIAADVKISGEACWTGSSDVIAISAKDFGMAFALTGTYVDDNDTAENAYYKCVGSGGSIAGKPQSGGWWCLNRYPDESTALIKGKVMADGSAISTFISGTGRHEGVTGEQLGTPIKQIGKAPQGKFAGCRTLTGNKVLK